MPELVDEVEFVAAAGGERYAYRRVGKRGSEPLVLLQHYREPIGGWDPLLLDVLGGERELILVDNAGVGASGGTTPCSIHEMARDIVVFVETLRLDRVDLLGLGSGGYVAQDVALLRPRLVRKLILAATGPQGGPEMYGLRRDVTEATNRDVIDDVSILDTYFHQSRSSQASGLAFLARLATANQGVARSCRRASREAQWEAMLAWGIPNFASLQRLGAIEQPTLVANGDSNIVAPLRLSYLLGALIPNAEVKVYPDAGHGFLFQHATAFGADIHRFLDA